MREAWQCEAEKRAPPSPARLSCRAVSLVFGVHEYRNLLFFASPPPPHPFRTPFSFPCRAPSFLAVDSFFARARARSEFRAARWLRPR